MLHRIFQLHDIPPDEVYRKEWRIRKFMYASELIAIDDEEEFRKKKGGR